MHSSTTQYARAWHQALQEAPSDQWDEVSQKFLTYLHYNGELGQLSDIMRTFKQIDESARNVVRTTVRSAHEVDHKEIGSVLEQVFKGQDLEVEYEIDETLLGGVQMITDNRRWDLSLRGQMRRLESELKV